MIWKNQEELGFCLVRRRTKDITRKRENKKINGDQFRKKDGDKKRQEVECRNILANEIHFTCTQKKKVLDIQKDEGGHLKETRMNRWRTVKGQMLNQKQTNKQKKKRITILFLNRKEFMPTSSRVPLLPYKTLNSKKENTGSTPHKTREFTPTIH